MNEKNTYDFFIKVIFYTKKRYIGENYFSNNITIFDIKQYYKEKISDGTTILYKNYFLNNFKLKDSDKITNILSANNSIKEISIALELREVEELKYQFSLIKFDDENDPIYSKIIKPKLNPFGLIVFLTKNSSIQIEQYPKEILDKYNLNKFNFDNYTYCNSPNFLFLSGENNFWIINKQTYAISHYKLKIYKKKHSMIYIHNIGVFLVGGDNKQTILYEIKTGKFKKWGDTVNNNIIKPGLFYYDEYLFCFRNLNKKNNFFEKTYLGENTQRKWEIIYPRFKNTNPNEFYNNNFALSKSTEGKILFIGGNKENKNTYIFNPLNDTIIKTEGKNEKIFFEEKNFYKLNKVINIAIPSDFEKSNELAKLNKYQFSLQKIKYKIIETGTSINYEINWENNIEIINDNKIGNISIELKIGGINKDIFAFIRTIGIPVFSQIYYNKYKQQFPVCICKDYLNHGSQSNLFQNNIEIKDNKILKRNKSQLTISKNNDNNNMNKLEVKNKNYINVIQKQNPIIFNQGKKQKINNNQVIDNNINIEINTKEPNQQDFDIKSDINEIQDNNNDINDINNENNEYINQENIEEKKEEKIEDNNNIKEEIKGEIKIQEKESIKISDKKMEENDVTFDVFSNIKEIRENPNYDRDESKMNKDFEKSNVTNFQLKESIQRNIISTKFNINSSEKNIDEEKISEDNNINEIYKENNEINEEKEQAEQNIENEEEIENNYKEEEQNKDKYEEHFDEQKPEIETENKEILENKEEIENKVKIENKEEEQIIDKNIDINKDKEQSEEQKLESEHQYQIEEEKEENKNINEINNDNQNKFEEIQNKEKEQYENIEQEQKKEENNIVENLLSNNEQNEELSNNKEEKDINEQEDNVNIEQEINEQKIHEDIDPNKIINIKENINIEDNNKEYQHQEQLEDYMAQNIEEDNDENYNENELDENIINNEKNFGEENLSNNEDLYNIESERINNEKEKENEKEIFINISKKEENLNLEQNEDKIESDFNNINKEESKEIEEKNEFKENIEDSYKKIVKEEKITNIENLEYSNKKEEEIENNNEEGEFLEINDQEENNYEEGEFQEIDDNEEINYEENEMSYEIDDNNEIKKEKEKNSIIHISDDNINHEEIIKKEKDLQKYQKFVKNVEYDEPEEQNISEDEK